MDLLTHLENSMKVMDSTHGGVKEAELVRTTLAGE
jgi:hypothetical protein